MESIKLKCPATIANMVCGFDVLGMAIEAPFDELVLSKRMEPGISIRHQDDYGLSERPEENILGVVLQKIILEKNIQSGFDILVTKHIKPGSGLGSSAASAAGIVVAADKLLQLQLSKEESIRFAMEGEFFATGSRHADNIAPCLFGGLRLVRDLETLDVVDLNMPDLHVAVVHPQIELKTSDARKVLPKEIPLNTAVKQWGNLAGWITGCLKGDKELMKRSMQDYVVEPARSRLIPGYDEVMTLLSLKGIIGGGISGSGPSLFLLTEDENTAISVADKMKAVYEKQEIAHKTYVTKMSQRGVDEF